MTFQELVDTLTSLVRNFSSATAGTDYEVPHYRDFKFMKEHNSGYYWENNSLNPHKIMVRSESCSLTECTNDLMFLSIDNSMPDMLMDHERSEEHDWNVLFLSEGKAALAVQRYSTTKFVVITPNEADDYRNSPVLDMLTFSEDEWFQTSLLYPVPSYEVMDKTREFFKILHTASYDNNLEYTMTVGLELDVNNLVLFKKEEFE